MHPPPDHDAPGGPDAHDSPSRAWALFLGVALLFLAALATLAIVLLAGQEGT